MKLRITILLMAFVMLGVSFINLPKVKKLKFPVPKGWGEPSYDFKNNPVTEEGFQLGRKLFYDGRLSKDGNFPCASCHQQFASFANFDHDVSHGFNNQFTSRNAPSLANLAWRKDFHWDGGVNHLDVQPLSPLTAHNEMAESIDSIIYKLKKDKEYKQMFKSAFGDDKINTERITKALSQFVVMMVSSNSKYDKVKRGEAKFNLPEQLGYEIFQRKCVSCHTEPLFTDNSFRNNGMSYNKYFDDNGRMRITNDSADYLKFRVPSLRNVAVTAPYGHDGRFFSLSNVFEHYRKNMIPIATTDSLLKNKMHLSNYEIGQLTAFLYSLTDSTFLKDPRFSAPPATSIPQKVHDH